MGKFDSYSDKVLDLVGQVGDNIRTALPDTAGKWLQTGAALGVAKTGTRAVGGFIRRNPAVAVATAVGAGVIWLAVRHHNKKKQRVAAREAIEGQSERVEARPEAPRRRRSARVRMTGED